MRIAYALAGEGRGHTTRALTLAKGLVEHGHEIAFFTCGDALELLQQEFGMEHVHQLETPRFVVVRKRISYVRTGFATLRFILAYPRQQKRVIRHLKSWKPDILITDFEPTFARVARRLNVPLISFNSQRFSVDAKLNHLLNRRQRLKLVPIRVLSRIFAPRPDLSLVSKGFNLEANKATAHLLGPMLRPAFTPDAWIPAGSHAIAYLRTSVLHHLPTLAAHAKRHGLVLKLYGHYPKQIPDNVEPQPISNDGFIRDLLTANWVVQTAGTQLLGEVGCIGIPSLCFPEPGQVEQEINGVLAMKTFSNIKVIHSRRVGVDDLDDALQRARSTQRGPEIANGTSQAVQLVHEFLNNLESIHQSNVSQANAKNNPPMGEQLSTTQVI